MATCGDPQLYCVPCLNVSEILETLNRLFNLEVKRTDINPGNADKLIEIYVSVLEHFGYDTRYLAQPNIQCLTDCDCDSESFIFIVNLYSLLNSFLKKILYKDLTIADLLNPNGERTQLVLSHILNYWKYYSCREAKMQKCLETYQYIIAQKARMEKNAPLDQRKMNDLAINLTELQQTNKTLSQNIEELRVHFSELMAKKEQVHKQSKEAASTIEKFIQVNQRDEQEVNELKVKLKKLEEKILDSPRHLPEKVEEKKNTLATLKSTVLEKKKILSAKADERRHIAECKDHVVNIHKLITEIADVVSSTVSLKNEIKSSEYTNEQIKEKISDLDEIHSHYLSALSSLHEQMTSLEIQCKAKIAALNSSLKEAKTCESNVCRAVNEMDVVVANKSHEYQDIVSQIESNKAALASVIQLSTLYTHSLSALDEFHASMQSYVEEVESAVKELLEAFEFSKRINVSAVNI